MAKGKKTGGRTKGTPNKTTKEIKEAYKSLLSNNINHLDQWINEVAKSNPAKAFEIVLKLSEFVLPKLKSIDAEMKTNTFEEQKRMIASLFDAIPTDNN